MINTEIQFEKLNESFRCKLMLAFIFTFFVFQIQYAQHQPYPVHDTKAVITEDPYLTAPSETSIMVNWVTDTPSHSKILYGKKGEELDKVAEVQEHGMRPVETKHAIPIKDLEPGQTYQYKVLSRRVVDLKPYWPEMGDWVESDEYSFTTLDKNKSKIAFSSITDTHEHVDWINGLMELVDWDKTDFFVQTGDALDYVESEKQLFQNWLSPIAKNLKQTVPFVYARGNHDLRGPFARNWLDYIPSEEDRFYFARNHGPVHFLILDSGEDKADSTNVYAGLNNLKEYRAEEYEWFKDHVENSSSLKEAPFRIVFMHDPGWGWMEEGEAEKWTELANKAGIDLIITGHWHRFKRIEKGEQGNDYPILVVGQKEIAHVEATDEKITIDVRDIENEQIDSFEIDKEGNIVDK